jgi:hypothetical protein
MKPDLPISFTRRQLLKSSAAALAGASLFSPLALAEKAGDSTTAQPWNIHHPGVKVRTVTSGPKHHWFAYYDKLEFDSTGRYLLSMEVDFEDRDPMADDVIRVGMIDLEDGNRWIDLGETRAWGWQQGCMLQWRPGHDDEVIWNDREGDRFVCRILNVKTRKLRTVPMAVYSVSPDGKTGVAPDFRRVNDMRPGYGYSGLADPFAEELAPSESGIWRVDLDTGEVKLIISTEQIAKIGWKEDISDCKHYFNHLLFNTDGTRFEFLHRWRTNGGKRKWLTRMLTAAPYGSDIRVIDDCGVTSHFIWRDPETILAWSFYPGSAEKFKDASLPYGFCLFEDKPGGGDIELVAGKEMYSDGHCTYLPGHGNRYILNDTYPGGTGRRGSVYLYDTLENKVIPLADFHMPKCYGGHRRIDLHPRASRDGKHIVVDAAYKDQGRQLHMISLPDKL